MSANNQGRNQLSEHALKERTCVHRSDTHYYRPIALLSCVEKVLKRIMTDRLSETAEAQGIFPDGQFGNIYYRKER